MNPITESNNNYRIARKYIDKMESPRKTNDFSKIVTFKGFILQNLNCVDEYFINKLTCENNKKDFIIKLASEVDENTVLDLKLQFNTHEISFIEFMNKLINLVSKKYLILPLVFNNDSNYYNWYSPRNTIHDISVFGNENIENYTGYIYVPYEKIILEYGNCDDEIISIVKQRLKKDLDCYQGWLLGDAIYNYRLIKVDDDNNEIEELESYGNFYGDNFKENGLYELIPDEYKNLLYYEKIITDYQVYKPLDNSISEITKFIKKEIPFDKMIKNSGIYETSELARFDEDDIIITIGVCYEDDHDDEPTYENALSEEVEDGHYYYNIFFGEEYVDIGCYGYKEDLIPESTVKKILDEIAYYAKREKITWIYEISEL